MAKGSGDDGSADCADESSGNKTGIESGSVLEEFKEVTEIRGLFKGLQDVYKDQIALERSCERVTYIVDQYQEQPHLIDPHLDVIVSDLLSLARNPNSPPKVMHEAFRYLYLITKMRGYKVVVRHLPHEVADVEPVLKLLNDQDPYDFGIWETRYMLLLWLSMVCMIPFDMSRLDSNAVTQSGSTRQPIMDRIIDVGKLYLPVADKSRDAAAYMLSHFLTRPDVKAQRLGQVLDWALLTLAKADYSQMAGMTCASGILRMLALLFKQGKRQDLLPVAPAILTKIEECKLMISSNTVLKKLAVKLVQRLGLIFLKNRVAAWRYQRGSRSLEENLKSPRPVSDNVTLQTSAGAEEGEEEEEYDIPDEIEDVIEHLLSGLKGRENVFRWSAAKGIGRITGRLPKELADDVVGSVLELFTLQESDEAWHGGCLALAELGRRGLLLPQRLSDVVPVVLRALAYDKRRGNFSVGAHVRDAACYVCWAFARAYDPKEIALYVTDIANALVIVSIFDREVNVRRAAAAAFQENVGRQGTFPHGIDILTTADYFAVGNRTHCYLDLSVYVANFPEYTTSLIDHLVQVKIAHWDTAMRELASKALHNLTPAAATYMAKTVVPTLLPQTTGLDLFQRHGAILAVAEIVHALALIADKENRSVTSMLDAESVNGLKDIAKTLHDAKLFRGMGGELMRKAVSTLIEKLSASKMPHHNDPVIDFWQEIIDDCLKHMEPDVQEAAVNAIPTFFSEYYRLPGGQVDPVRQEAVTAKYLHEIRSDVEVTRKGFSLALGAFPKFMLMGKLRAVIDGLIQASLSSDKDAKWAESSRDCLKAITSINRTIDIDPKGSPNHALCEANVGAIYDALLQATKNYTMDSRGDIGAWVREASMTGLEELTCKLVQSHPSLIQPDVSKAVFCCLVQQACEKIDRTRAHAGSIFAKLLHHSPQIPHVPHRKELEQIFSRSSLQYVNWGAPAQTFCLFTRLLAYPVYRYPIFLGLTVSMGGLTESLVNCSSNSTFTFLRTLAKDRQGMTQFTETLLQVFSDYQKVDRVSIPLLKTIDQLLTRGCFDVFLADDDNPFAKNVLDHCKKEIYRSGDPQKLMASADVFCGLLPFGQETCKKAMFQLLILLCHKYPRVRKTTANKLYEAFVTYEEVVPPDSLDEVMTLLSETNWDEGQDVIKPIRNRLCDLLQVPQPVVKKVEAKT